MHLSTALFSLGALASTALAATNTTQEYYLKTALKPHQRNKAVYDNLYLVSYHTGAGLSDATFDKNVSIASKGFLNNTAQEFDLGTEFPFHMTVQSTVGTYSGWEPVRVNAGSGQGAAMSTGFSLNSTGLQWDTAVDQDPQYNQFGGWLVCDWWHGVPQLFSRLDYNFIKAPSSCADVNLIPEYI